MGDMTRESTPEQHRARTDLTTYLDTPLIDVSNALAANYDTGPGPTLYDTVIELWSLRRHKERINVLAANAKHTIHCHYEGGARTVGKRRIILLPERPPQRIPWVYSHTARDHYPKKWAAARILDYTPRLQNLHRAEPTPLPQMPDLSILGDDYPHADPTAIDLPDAWAWRSQLRALFTDLHERDTILKQRLITIAEHTTEILIDGEPMWDGQKVIFAGEWDVRACSRRYDSPTFQRIAPQEFDELAVTINKGGAAEKIIFEPQQRDEGEREGERERDERDWELDGEREIEGE